MQVFKLKIEKRRNILLDFKTVVTNKEVFIIYIFSTLFVIFTENFSHNSFNYIVIGWYFKLNIQNNKLCCNPCCFRLNQVIKGM